MKAQQGAIGGKENQFSRFAGLTITAVLYSENKCQSNAIGR